VLEREKFHEGEKRRSDCVDVKQLRNLGRENPRRWCGVWGTQPRPY
jgi:hypothetical protein